MRAFILAVCLLCSSAFGSDIIDLKHQLASFTDSQGHSHTNVLLVRADLDGITYTEPDSVGGSRVSFTNLAPGLLESWGIPTNRIGIAENRAEKKAKVDKQYKESMTEQAQRYAEEKAIAEKQRPQIEARQKADAKTKDLQDRRKAIQDQNDLVRRLKRESDRLEERCYQDGSTVSSGLGASIDTPETRMNAYYKNLRALREAKEKLEDMQAGRK